MAFWIAVALLSLLAVAFVAVPLWRRRHLQDFESEQLRRQANIALFHERSNELEADLAAGNIDRRQYDSLVLELQQNLLSDVSEADVEMAPAAAAKMTRRSRLSFILPLIAALLVPPAAFLLYQEWGYREDVELMDLFERTVNNQNDQEAARDLIFELGEVVQGGNDQPWARYFLAENLAAIGLFEQAQRFYEEAAELIEESPDKSVILGRVAMAMYINGEFEMTPEIRAVTDEALALNPNSVAVLQLLAADAEQRGDYAEAIENWRRLIQVNPNSREAESLRGRIADAQRLMNDGEEVDSPSLTVRVALAEGLELDSRLRVFVAARNAEREGMPPLAATVLTVADLPVTLTLDDSLAVGPFNLSSAERVNVSALVSYAGVATPQSGDYRVQSGTIVLDEADAPVELVISDPIP